MRGLRGARSARGLPPRSDGMRHPVRILVASLLLGGLAGCHREEARAPAEASPPTAARPAPGALAFVEGLVGRYPREVRLLETPPLSTRLQALLGDRYELLGPNLEVQGPISEQNGVVYVTGNKEHAGGSDAAIVVIDVPGDSLHVWLLVSGSLQEYREKAVDRPLPEEVQNLLASWGQHP